MEPHKNTQSKRLQSESHNLKFKHPPPILNGQQRTHPEVSSKAVKRETFIEPVSCAVRLRPYIKKVREHRLGLIFNANRIAPTIAHNAHK